MASEKLPKKRPVRTTEQKGTKVLTFRVLDTLVSEVEQYAKTHGISRNQAGKQLIEAGLARMDTVPPSGGYNSRTGEFEW